MSAQLTNRLVDLRTQIHSMNTQYEVLESEYQLLNSYIFTGGALGALGALLSYAISPDKQISDSVKWEAIQAKKSQLCKKMENIKAVREELQAREHEVLGLALGDAN